MSEKCKESVQTPGMMSFHQCRKSARKDGFCKVHHPDSVKARQEESERKWREKMDSHPIAMLRREKEAHDATKAETKRLREALEAEVESEKASKAFTDFLADSGKGKTTKEVMDEFERLQDACHEKRREYVAKREAALASAEQQNTNPTGEENE